MCLIAIAHRVTEKWPLVIAANRDESYDRPTRASHAWEEDPRVIGGRDLRAGGSWLAVRRDGRFAAVTNVRGIGRAEGGCGTDFSPSGRAKARPTSSEGPPSRGLLVSDFVLGNELPLAYAQRVTALSAEYAGFHLIVGDGDIVHCSSNSMPAPIDGLFAVSNAPPGVEWPKVAAARHALAAALEHDDVAGELLRFLSTSIGGEIPYEVFVKSPRYGTRSSTVIVGDASGKILLIERSYPGGEELRFQL